jgi:hypothetical protein
MSAHSAFLQSVKMPQKFCRKKTSQKTWQKQVHKQRDRGNYNNKTEKCFFFLHKNTKTVSLFQKFKEGLKMNFCVTESTRSGDHRTVKVFWVRSSIERGLSKRRFLSGHFSNWSY